MRMSSTYEHYHRKRHTREPHITEKVPIRNTVDCYDFFYGEAMNEISPSAEESGQPVKVEWATEKKFHRNASIFSPISIENRSRDRNFVVQDFHRHFLNLMRNPKCGFQRGLTQFRAIQMRHVAFDFITARRPPRFIVLLLCITIFRDNDARQAQLELARWPDSSAAWVIVDWWQTDVCVFVCAFAAFGSGMSSETIRALSRAFAVC